MAHAQVLSSVGLIKPRRRGFCPACRLFLTGDAPQDVSPPALVALSFVLVAALAWGVSIMRMSSMDMTMGLGAFSPFITSWALMMAAMMLPTATPLVFEFARNAEGRRGWQAAAALLGTTYLGVWVGSGAVLYVMYTAVGMPWPNQPLIGAAALVLAGAYALTPVKQASEASCRERCALHVPLPFNLMRSAIVAGARYGLSCIGCSAGLMVALVLVGVTNLALMIVLAAVVLVYKLAPAPSSRSTLALSGALVALGFVYAVGG